MMQQRMFVLPARSGEILKINPAPQRHGAGFSLIEVIIAVALLLIVFVSALSLINRTVQRLAIPRDQVIASNLAAEGIEVVRNLRDSNWLRIPATAWDTGLTIAGCSASSAAGLAANTCLGAPCPARANVAYDSTGLSFLAADTLYHDASGTYSHIVSSTPSQFSREVLISYCKDSDSIVYMRVEGSLGWSDRGVQKSFIAVDHLYDWLPVQ